MKKYFYLVEFSYLTTDNEKSSFNLGVFSIKSNADKKISYSYTQKGFNKYPLDNFKVKKFGVDFENANVDKSKSILYCVSHEYCIDESQDEYAWTIFGYFSTCMEAEKKVLYLKKHSRIGKKYPDNFEINEIKVDNYNSWSEGFVEIE